ncbi:MAG: hypothetical protein L6Q38_02520 [Nitrospira sp.]|nr:hypothetical protein [Planctomycetota bacterium]MCK6498335.1 hypothetical protein [Nitrospira sp.]
MRNLKSRCLFLLIATSACLMNSGCSGVSLGPQVRTEYVILHAGRPMKVLENSKVKGRTIDGTGDAVEQNVGGWVMMPEDHWESVKRGLERK